MCLETEGKAQQEGPRSHSRCRRTRGSFQRPRMPGSVHSSRSCGAREGNRGRDQRMDWHVHVGGSAFSSGRNRSGDGTKMGNDLTWGRRERDRSEGLFRFAIERLQLVEMCAIPVPTAHCITIYCSGIFLDTFFSLPASVYFLSFLPQWLHLFAPSPYVLSFVVSPTGDSFHILSHGLHLHAQALLRPGFLRQLQNSRR
jgi:hypothetical protein